MKNSGTFKSNVLMRNARFYAAGICCAALLFRSGAASAQGVRPNPGAAPLSSGAVSAPQAKSKEGDAWRMAWKNKWSANSKTHTAAWRAEWRKEWEKTTQKSALAALKSAPAVASHAAPKQNIKAVLAPGHTETSAAPILLPALAKSRGAAPIAPQKQGVTPKTLAPKTVPAPPASVPAPALSAKLAAPGRNAAPVAPPAPAPAAKSAVEKSTPNALTGTRPDPAAETKKVADKPLDSPLGAIGDGGKMFLCLIPTVLVMVGALHLLRRFQEKNGRLPAFARMGKAPKSAVNPAPAPPKIGLLQSLLGGVNRKQTTDSSGIRVIESVPMGSANLHLIEVRGRTLLLGASASGLNLLTEIEEADPLVNNEFRLLLEQATGDMDSLGLPDEALPASLLVGTLDDPLRDANQAVTRGTRRLRTVQETESAWEQEGK